jgi:membrane-bound metal-dependent hydrolase YbcI (DUF457 family)
VQNLSHRVFNSALAASIIVKFHQKFLAESIIIACGMVLFSSFPDSIEKIGLKHRGISHSLILYLIIAFDLACLIVIYPQGYWLYITGIAFVLGCLGHVLADIFSKNGIKVLGYPLKARCYSTGKLSERIFLFVFVLINIALITIFLQ